MANYLNIDTGYVWTEEELLNEFGEAYKEDVEKGALVETSMPAREDAYTQDEINKFEEMNRG